MEDVKIFAEKHGFNSARDCRFTWKGHSVYHVYNIEQTESEDGGDLALGYPSFVLKNDMGLRLVTTVDESQAIIRAMPNEFGNKDA